jgi:glycosyltransferase involved in cell wall biosynthesis
VHVLHTIHDFLPRHRAGSEIYAFELARAQMDRHDVTILCADFDPNREHGHVVWRVHDGVPVVELINNWRCASFEETYRPPLITDRIRHVLRTLRPDVVHVHNLLNLSFDLPACAHELGIPVVATLHDYTLVCASGGQRVHRRDQHVCHDIDPARCARCFSESPFSAYAAVGRLTGRGTGGAVARRAAAAVRKTFPVLASRAANAVGQIGGLSVTPEAIDARLEAARRVFHEIDLFVAPSASIGHEFERFGLPADRIKVSGYGMPPLTSSPRPAPHLPLRIGFVGTLVWHKGAHLLIEAMRALPKGSCRVSLFGETATFPDYAADLRACAAGLPVEFAGGFEKRQVADVYSQMDVLVVPSIWPENSPLVIHEALMAGVPVVGARIGGIPELVTNEVSGYLFAPGSADALADVLRRIIDRPEVLTTLAAGAPLIKTTTADAEEWEATYRSLVRTEARTA